MRRLFAGEAAITDEYAEKAVLRVQVCGLAGLLRGSGSRSTSPVVMEDADGTVRYLDDTTEAEGARSSDTVRALGLALLHDVASIAEQLAMRHGVALQRYCGGTLTVVGDSVGGGTDAPTAAELTALAEFSLDLTENVVVWCAARWGGSEAMAQGIGLRSGLSVGQLSAGLLGYERFGYYSWGRGVQEAGALCTKAILNTTACSTAAKDLLPSKTSPSTLTQSHGLQPTLFRFEHREGAEGGAAALACGMHTLLEREQHTAQEGGGTSALSGRASTRNLVRWVLIQLTASSYSAPC